MQLTHIGDYKIRLKSIDSTNNYASSLFSLGKPAEGTVVLSDFQEKGKGQVNATWESERGLNLLASFILYPVIDMSDYFLLNQAMSLAVREAIAGFMPGPEVTIKWPNDILAGERKIGGILIENSIRGNQFAYSIVGTGINVNQDDFSSYKPEATSLRLETGNETPVERMLEALCATMNTWYAKLKSGDAAAIRKAYHDALFGKGASRVFLDNQSLARFEAVIAGVRDDGKLILRTADGRTRHAAFKEVAYRF